MLVNFFFNISRTQFRENLFGSQETFIKPAFFWETYFYSYIYISTMKIAHLPQTPPNMSSIGEVWASLGKTFLMSFVVNHRATGGLRMNSSSVKGGLINFPFFLLKGNAILPMTPKVGCVDPEPLAVPVPVLELTKIFWQFRVRV